MNANTPNRPRGNTINIDTVQLQQTAASMVDFFNLDTTLIPGSKRGQVSVLTTILVGIANGKLQVVPTPEKEVESTEQTGRRRKRPPEVQAAIDRAEKVEAIAELDGVEDDAAASDSGQEQPGS